MFPIILDIHHTLVDIFTDILHCLVCRIPTVFSLLSFSFGPKSSFKISWVHADYLAINLSGFKLPENGFTSHLF